MTPTPEFIGILGLVISVLPPIGSMLLIVTGVLIAGRLTPPETTDGRTPQIFGGGISDLRDPNGHLDRREGVT